jgi:serine protease Do
VGDKVPVTVWRDGKQLELNVQTAELPGSQASQGDRPVSGEGKLGLTLQTLTPDLSDRLGIDKASKGAVITAVRPGSSAAKAGLRTGDVIVEVDRQQVASADDAAKRLGSRRAGGHLARILRGDGSLFVVVPAG